MLNSCLRRPPLLKLNEVCLKYRLKVKSLGVTTVKRMRMRELKARLTKLVCM